MLDFDRTPLALLGVVTLLLLAIAAWRDIATRTIPNTISLALVAVGLMTRLHQGWDAAGFSLAVSLGLFVLLLPLHARGFLGGADLKLLAALAVGLSPIATCHLIGNVTIVGGLLAILYVVLRVLAAHSPARPRPIGRIGSRLSRIAAVEWWRIRRHAPLPYGIAIAAGAAFIVLQQQGV